MASQDFNIRLEGGGPWGFRLTGGKDFCSPLTVSKITPGGKASYNGLREGDTIVTINYEDCTNMVHMDAQDAIKNTGNTLDLSVRRGGSPKTNRTPLTKTEVIHSSKVDHKYNAIPKPFGAPSYQPPPPTGPPPVQSAPAVRTGPPPTAPKPSSPMAPAYSHYTGGPPRNTNAYPRDQTDNSEADMRAKKKEIEEEMLSQRFKLAISDDGEVNYDEQEQVPNWGHPPDPNVQSKSFKMLQRHLQKHEEDDDLPPPPPEAYEPEEDHSNVQSKSFQMLQSAVDSGDTPPSVFSRDRGDRSKPSTTPVPTRPVVPITKSTPEYSAPPPSRPGQAPPVALPGMAIKEPAHSAQPPRMRTQRPQAPSYQHHSQPPAAPRAPGYGGGGGGGGGGQHQEIKRQPIKPPQPTDGSRTPYCDACGEEIFGPFVSAIGRSWHPDHFTCAGCGDSLQNQGFIEEGGKLYCEKDYNKHFAPQCYSCKQPIIGPKSLHACVFPPSQTTPKSSVPPPSPDMLKAIREGKPTTKIPKQPQVNPSLTVKKKSISEDRDFGKVHFPVHGIDYMTRKESTSHSRTSSVSSDSTRTSETFSDGDSLISPKTVQQFERLHHEMTYVEPGSGSMKDKVRELKQELRKAEEEEKFAKEGKALAFQRIKDCRIQSKDLKTRIQDAEDKLQRTEIKLQDARGKLYERQRIVEESLGNKQRAENVTKETVREKQNFEYEISEANAARDSALNRLRELSRRLTIKQAAIQNAEDHRNAMIARAKMLTDMKDMYQLRINNIHSKSANLNMKSEKHAYRIHILQDSIASYTERFKRAEKMLLPLKMYVNQLQDALSNQRENTTRLSYELVNCQQRLRGAQMYSDL